MLQINGELSDLFFNHRNDNYDRLFPRPEEGYGRKDDSSFQQELETAIFKDAEDFVKCYPDTMRFFGNSTAQELASDFLKRL